MLSKFLDPKNDVAFKKIFGTEKNKDILIHFLNDMITFKEKGKIVDVTFLKTVQDPETAAKKTSIVDILCKDEKGNSYIVEMQVSKEKGFEKRAQYYASKAYISQANVGGEYHALKEIIFIAIAEFVMFPNKKEYKSDHVVLDRISYEHDLKDFSYTFIELPKFDKSIDRLSDITDKWCYFFKHAEETSEQEVHQLIGNDAIIQRAFEELNRFHWNDEEILIYEQAEKYEGAYRASLAQQYDDGKAEGLVEGKAEGLNEGVMLGQLKIIKKLIKSGLSLQSIGELTGISIDELKKIQNSIDA